MHVSVALFLGIFGNILRCFSAPDRGADYCDERVCLPVCLSVRDPVFGTTRPIFTKFFVHVPVAVARSSSGGVVICHVLRVLWMTIKCS